MILGCRKLFTS